MLPRSRRRWVQRERWPHPHRSRRRRELSPWSPMLQMR
jgi:hypothetical protein